MINKVIERVYVHYCYLYSLYGITPTRIVLGIDVLNAAREENQQAPTLNGVTIENDGTFTCLGLPVTVDMMNRDLISVGIGEDYRMELEGDKE